MLVGYCVEILLSPLTTQTNRSIAPVLSASQQKISEESMLDSSTFETAPGQLFVGLSIRVRYHHREMASLSNKIENINDFETKWG